MTKSAFAERIDAAREYFSLRQTEQRAKAIPEDARTKLATTFALARQKREAAEVLWLAGELAEGFKLARDAFLLAHDVSAVAPPDVDRVAAVKKSLDDVKTPELDADVGDAHKKLFTDLVDGYDLLDRDVSPLALDTKRLAQKRRQRVIVGALSFVAFFAVLGWLLHTPRTLRAEASATIGPQFPASNVTDGRNDTEWFLPDRTNGWLDLWVGPPRRLKTLKVLNAIAAPWNDRGTKDYHIEVYERGGRLAKSIDGSLPFDEHPKWVSIPIDTDVAVERIRFEARSYHRTGAGLAEVEVE